MTSEIPSKPRVLLIGTYHAYQRNMPGYNRQCKAPKFKEDMVSIISEYSVDCLLEEMSEYALFGAQSWLKGVGEELRISHCFIDPGQSERARLLIPEKNFDREENFTKREQYWLERVGECNFNTALCVIGSDHITGFQKLLMKDFDCVVLDHCYDPANIGNFD